MPPQINDEEVVIQTSSNPLIQSVIGTPIFVSFLERLVDHALQLDIPNPNKYLRTRC